MGCGHWSLEDDNEESIKKRFRTFVETSMPVVEHFEKEGKVVKVDATPEPEEVYKNVKAQFVKRGVQESRTQEQSAKEGAAAGKSVQD